MAISFSCCVCRPWLAGQSFPSQDWLRDVESSCFYCSVDILYSSAIGDRIIAAIMIVLIESFKLRDGILLDKDTYWISLARLYLRSHQTTEQRFFNTQMASASVNRPVMATMCFAWSILLSAVILTTVSWELGRVIMFVVELMKSIIPFLVVVFSFDDARAKKTSTGHSKTIQSNKYLIWKKEKSHRQALEIVKDDCSLPPPKKKKCLQF